MTCECQPVPDCEFGHTEPTGTCCKRCECGRVLRHHEEPQSCYRPCMYCGGQTLIHLPPADFTICRVRCKSCREKDRTHWFDRDTQSWVERPAQ